MMEKSVEVLITQITCTDVMQGQANRSTAIVLGLGDDQQVYAWNRASSKWYLYTNQG